MIKNVVTISLMIFITLVVVILGAAVFLKPNTPNFSVISTNQNAVQNLNTTNGLGITSVEVAKHNSASDCWQVVGRKVYDVTKFIPLHSGGAGQIITFCGKDATVAFDTQGGSGSHRQEDLNILSNYYIGDLGGTNTLPSPTISPNINRKNENDGE